MVDLKFLLATKVTPDKYVFTPRQTLGELSRSINLKNRAIRSSEYDEMLERTRQFCLQDF